MRQNASAYAYVSMRQHTLTNAARCAPVPPEVLERAEDARLLQLQCLPYVSIRQHTSAYVSIRQHTSAYVSTRMRMLQLQCPPYVSIRQHMSAPAYICGKPHTSCMARPTPAAGVGRAAYVCGLLTYADRTCCMCERAHMSAARIRMRHVSSYADRTCCMCESASSVVRLVPLSSSKSVLASSTIVCATPRIGIGTRHKA